MLAVLSPAKSLDYDSPVADGMPHTLPSFVSDAAQLIAVLRQHTPQAIASLMHISDPLAALNVARYAAWQPEFTHDNARQALLAFNGDVYDGLQASSLSVQDLQWAQQHVAILSGLYGVLRPLDWMQPYRLEMGATLATDRGRHLYAFWGRRIADHLNTQLDSDPHPIVVNLASQEYFKAVDRRVLRAPVIDCVFEDWKNDGYKIISFYAKKARGAMARHIITSRASSPQDLQAFTTDGYAWDATASTHARLVFRRKPI